MIPAVILLIAKVTLATVAGLAAVHAARRSRAAVRHVLLAATFAVVIALPFASFVAPAISITVPVTSTTPASDPIVSPLSDRDTATPTAPSTIASRTPPASATTRVSWTSVLFVLWLAGVALFVSPLAVGLWQLRHLRRLALPSPRAQAILDQVTADAGIRRAVEVLRHESTPGPLTFGVVRPAILLPADAESWPDDDLRRAVTHELEHVRRGDWITQCLARAACAGYWCHPLVWIVWRRFALEAERACDDAVLRRSEATAYADQLVGLAKRLTARQPLLAMANRADLSTRVGAVLDDRQPRGRAGARWIAAAAMAALAIVIGVSPLRLVAAVQTSSQGTTTNTAKLRYDAAVLKPCVAEERPTGARGTYGGTNANFSPGHFTVPCVTAGQLIYLAYAAGGVDPADRLVNDDAGTAASAQKLRGGPDWVHSLKDKYFVEATAAGVTERTVLMGAMLRTLIEERFKLKLHRETEEVAMYAMTVAKGGLKVKPMKEGDCLPYDGSPIDRNAPKPTCGNLSMMTVNGGITQWDYGSTTFDGLAHGLARVIGAPVLDRTNVSDKFIIRLRFRRDEDAKGTSEVSDRATGAAVPAELRDAPPIATALEEQIGLTLEKLKGPRGYLVIDHIERPVTDAPTSAEATVGKPARAQGAGPAGR